MTSVSSVMGALFTELQDGVLLARPESVGPHHGGVIAGGPLISAAVLVSGQAGGPTRLGRLTASFHAAVFTAGEIRWERIASRGGRRVVELRVLFRQKGRVVCTVDMAWLTSAPGRGVVASNWPTPTPTAVTPNPIATWNGGYFGGALRVHAGGFNGVGASNARLELTTAIIQGRANHPVAEIAGALDVAHAIGAPITSWPPRSEFINPDLTVCFAREPRERQVTVHAHALWSGDGTGLTVGTVTDSAGVLGQVSQCQVLTDRDQPTTDDASC